jgi:hypothetical protein
MPPNAPHRPCLLDRFSASPASANSLLTSAPGACKGNDENSDQRGDPRVRSPLRIHIHDEFRRFPQADGRTAG